MKVGNLGDLSRVADRLLKVRLARDLGKHFLGLFRLEDLVVAMIDGQNLHTLSLRLADAMQTTDQLEDGVDVITKLERPPLAIMDSREGREGWAVKGELVDRDQEAYLHDQKTTAALLEIDACPAGRVTADHDLNVGLGVIELCDTVSTLRIRDPSTKGSNVEPQKAQEAVDKPGFDVV